MKINLIREKILIVAAILAFAATAQATGFTNGGFEDGNTNGWTTGTGFRNSVDNTAISPSQFLPGGLLNDPLRNNSAVVGAGFAPHTNGQLSQVQSGLYAFRAEDTTYGGYASAIKQSVTNYTNSDIFFAWAAVLEGAHTATNAATFKLTLTDDTTGSTLITRQYNAATGGSGVDARFTFDNGYYFTKDWQIEQLNLAAGSIGHDFTLSLLASDCQPTGHSGTVYLDGFGAFVPPPGPTSPVPEPSTFILLGAGLAGLAFARKRFKK